MRKHILFLRVVQLNLMSYKCLHGALDVGRVRQAKRTSFIVIRPRIADKMLKILFSLSVAVSIALGRSPIQSPGMISSMVESCTC